MDHWNTPCTSATSSFIIYTIYILLFSFLLSKTPVIFLVNYSTGTYNYAFPCGHDQLCLISFLLHSCRFVSQMKLSPSLLLPDINYKLLVLCDSQAYYKFSLFYRLPTGLTNNLLWQWVFMKYAVVYFAIV